MADQDWGIFRTRPTRMAASLIGQRATCLSSSGLDAKVQILALDDSGTQAHVRHCFGEAWVPLTQLQFRV